MTPPEAASESCAILTAANDTIGVATAKLDFPSDTYNIAINYFDLAVGVSEYEVFLNEELIGSWKGDAEYTLATSLRATWTQCRSCASPSMRSRCLREMF